MDPPKRERERGEESDVASVRLAASPLPNEARPGLDKPAAAKRSESTGTIHSSPRIGLPGNAMSRRNSSAVSLWGAPKQPLPTVSGMLAAQSLNDAAAATLWSPRSSLSASASESLLPPSTNATTTSTGADATDTTDTTDANGNTPRISLPGASSDYLFSIGTGGDRASETPGTAAHDIEDIVSLDLNAPTHDEDLLDELIEATPRVAVEFSAEPPAAPDSLCPSCHRFDCPTTNPVSYTHLRAHET